jgi:hypothetical protein
MSALAVVDASGSPPHDRSPARAELGRAIAELAEAVRAHARVQEPVDRLNAIIAAVAAAETELATYRASDDAAVAEFIAEGHAATGRPRPAVSEATLRAEKTLSALITDGRAARAALPARQEAFVRAGELVKALQAMRDSARFRVAAEAAIAYAETELRKLAQAAMDAEATVEGVLVELRQVGIVTGDREALSAVERIIAARAAVRGGITAEGDVGRARRLLARLATDADAQL